MDDTETLIALVSSLLDRVVDQETILETLVLADGDIQRAAEILNGVWEGQNKRKRTKLDGWLRSAKTSTTKQTHLTQTEEASSSTTIKPKSNVQTPSKPPSKPQSKPSVDLMAVLRQPPTEDKSKRKVKGLPPLMLSNPSMVTEHTPCTLHLSVLPPELACRLFYTMIEASKEWQRNKWWLFDRVVESPHRTSFYARFTGNSFGDERDATEWQEAAQYWYVTLSLALGLIPVRSYGTDILPPSNVEFVQV